MERKETYVKLSSGKYHFIGWYPIKEDFCIDTKKRVIKGKTHLYKKYKYKNGEVEELKIIL